MARLKGADLLSYLAEHRGQPRDTLIEGAGYTASRGGKLSLQRTRFFEALAAANGHELGGETATRNDGNGKTATYKLKVGPKGLIPVSRAYSEQCGMVPGSYVNVIIEDGAIILEPTEAAAGQPKATEGEALLAQPAGAASGAVAAPAQPPVASLASVA